MCYAFELKPYYTWTLSRVCALADLLTENPRGYSVRIPAKACSENDSEGSPAEVGKLSPLLTLRFVLRFVQGTFLQTMFHDGALERQSEGSQFFASPAAPKSRKIVNL